MKRTNIGLPSDQYRFLLPLLRMGISIGLHYPCLDKLLLS